MENDMSGSGAKGWWRRLWRKPQSKWLLGIPLGAYLMFLVGASTVAGSQVAIHMTGTEEFCTTACHSMEAFTTPEWQDSIHYSNRSGVRATCADCHIPKVYPDKLIVKTKAGISDAYHTMMGTISTREKYEANRLRMAEQVWDYMRKVDSRECRNCHNADYFKLSNQDERAARAHQKGLSEGKTCIDCHKGIAHLTPDEVAENEEPGGSEPAS